MKFDENRFGGWTYSIERRSDFLKNQVVYTKELAWLPEYLELYPKFEEKLNDMKSSGRISSEEYSVRKKELDENINRLKSELKDFSNSEIVNAVAFAKEKHLLNFIAMQTIKQLKTRGCGGDFKTGALMRVMSELLRANGVNSNFEIDAIKGDYFICSFHFLQPHEDWLEQTNIYFQRDVIEQAGWSESELKSIFKSNKLRYYALCDKNISVEGKPRPYFDKHDVDFFIFAKWIKERDGCTPVKAIIKAAELLKTDRFEIAVKSVKLKPDEDHARIDVPQGNDSNLEYIAGVKLVEVLGDDSGMQVHTSKTLSARQSRARYKEKNIQFTDLHWKICHESECGHRFESTDPDVFEACPVCESTRRKTILKK
ncbi:MAG TPA: hypothetical protein PLQ76_02945 [bacterium]|nr:hypothetical protein [bacterium]